MNEKEINDDNHTSYILLRYKLEKGESERSKSLLHLRKQLLLSRRRYRLLIYLTFLIRLRETIAVVLLVMQDLLVLVDNFI